MATLALGACLRAGPFLVAARCTVDKHWKATITSFPIIHRHKEGAK